MRSNTLFEKILETLVLFCKKLSWDTLCVSLQHIWSWYLISILPPQPIFSPDLLFLSPQPLVHLCFAPPVFPLSQQITVSSANIREADVEIPAWPCLPACPSLLHSGPHTAAAKHCCHVHNGRYQQHECKWWVPNHQLCQKWGESFKILIKQTQCWVTLMPLWSPKTAEEENYGWCRSVYSTSRSAAVVCSQLHNSSWQ